MNSQIHERLLVGLFLAVIITVPVTQTAFELSRGARPQVLDVFSRIPSEENLRAFESELEESSWIANRTRPHLRQVQFSLLRNPGNKVLTGRDGWMFYKPGVDYLIQSGQDDLSQQTGPLRAVRAITRFRDQLASRDIRLLVVLVPGKAAVYPDKLTRRADRARLRSRTLDVIAALSDAGVETVDLFKAFQESRDDDGQVEEPLYLARDTHWSPHGVQIAAEAINRRISELGWLEPGSVQFESRRKTIEREGDIVRMMQLPNAREFFATEPIHCRQIVLARVPYKDDSNSPVLFLGDSFSRIYQTDPPHSAGLIAHLADELKLPLASIVNDGGASTLVRQQLARRPKILDGKRLVIWQFVERDIQIGTEGWKDVPL